tara:strand:+ start:3238 stop:3915 length:678 start_codon:yes stop_codon:yes gene_type:complete
MAFDFIINIFRGFREAIPVKYQLLFDLFLYTIFIAIYAIFIWKFYKFLASREIIQLNLKQYNHSQYPGLEKLFAVALFTVEYMIILPFLVFFWFTILSLFLLLLSESQSAQQILLIAAAIIASTRITSYISEDLSKDLAKIFPFTVLALFILQPNFFNLENMFAKIGQIPGLFSNIVVFLVFIFAVEFILRGVYSIIQLMRSDVEAEQGLELVAQTRPVKRVVKK